MTQQNPQGNSNMRYKKRLFVDTGMGYVEVKARIVEPYTPPTPQYRAAEQKILNAPSHIMSDGITSYKASLTLLFQTKQDMSDYLLYSGWTHKFYDERGAIYLGTVESMRPTVVEASRRYKVEMSLLLVKKASYEKQNRFEFQDIQGHPRQLDIEEMANLGLVSVIAKDGQPVLYFRPEAFITRAEFVAFCNRTRKFIEKVVRE